VHITNCRANADLELMGTTTTSSDDNKSDEGDEAAAVPLGEYHQSISASVATLTKRFATGIQIP